MGAIVDYLDITQRGNLPLLRPPQRELSGGAMQIDAATRRNLEITHSLSLAGECEEALDWLENTVRIGNINYPFWAQHDEWVDSIRGSSRFHSIMSDVEREWQSLT